MKASLTMAAMIAVAVHGATRTLTENVTKWDANIEFDPAFSFTPTAGLSLKGEVGWHTHGSGDIVDVDVDLAFIISSTEPIDPSYTTKVLWGIPIENFGSTVDKYEVGLWEYKRGTLTEPDTWNLT